MKIAAALCVAALLVGCAGSGETESSTTEGASSATESDNAAPTDDTPLRVGVTAVVQSLDPLRYEGATSKHFQQNTSGMLLRYPLVPEGSIEPPALDDLEGDLAESWTVAEDGTSVEFVLRESYSPFGNPVTSEDVAWSIERMIASEASALPRILLTQGGWDLENPVDVVDERTFQANLVEYNAYSLPVLTLFFTTILDSTAALEHATDEDPWASEWLNENLASFGPYGVEAFTPGEQVTLVENEGNWRGNHGVSRVVMQSVPESSTRFQLVTAGEIDIAHDLSYDELSRVQSDGQLQVWQTINADAQMLGLNTSAPALEDVAVRAAILRALDREQLVDSAYRGFAEPSTSYFHYSFGVDPGLPFDDIEGDVDRLDGVVLELAYNDAAFGPHTEDVAIAIQQQLSAAGATVNLNDFGSIAEFDEAKDSGNLEMWLEQNLPLVSDPAWHLEFHFRGRRGELQRQFVNDDLDRLTGELVRTAPGPERDALLTEANTLLAENVVAIPLADRDEFFVAQPDLTGFRANTVSIIDYSLLSKGA